MHYYHYCSFSKQLTVAHSLYHSAGYYSVFFVTELVWLHLYFLSMNLCSCAFLEPFLPWKAVNITDSEIMFYHYLSRIKRACAILLFGPARLHRIPKRYVLNGRIFEEKLLDIKFCFDFLHCICMKHF